MLREAVKAREFWSQKVASMMFKVDPRELRDFHKYHSSQVMTTTPSEQEALDDAYYNYCSDGARLAFHAYVESSARQFGINPRALREKWETDRLFFPTQPDQTSITNGSL